MQLSDVINYIGLCMFIFTVIGLVSIFCGVEIKIL